MFFSFAVQNSTLITRPNRSLVCTNHRAVPPEFIQRFPQVPLHGGAPCAKPSFPWNTLVGTSHRDHWSKSFYHRSQLKRWWWLRHRWFCNEPLRSSDLWWNTGFQKGANHHVLARITIFFEINYSTRCPNFGEVHDTFLDFQMTTW